MRPHDDKFDGDPTQTGDESPSAVEGTRDDATLRLVAEELAVAKVKVEIGRVRISTRTHEREALIDETLARERIEIKTVPVGLRISAIPEVRQEGDTTIVPVVEEELRHQEAFATRDQDNSGSDDTPSAADEG